MFSFRQRKELNETSQENPFLVLTVPHFWLRMGTIEWRVRSIHVNIQKPAKTFKVVQVQDYEHMHTRWIPMGSFFSSADVLCSYQSKTPESWFFLYRKVSFFFISWTPQMQDTPSPPTSPTPAHSCYPFCSLNVAWRALLGSCKLTCLRLFKRQQYCCLKCTYETHTIPTNLHMYTCEHTGLYLVLSSGAAIVFAILCARW